MGKTKVTEYKCDLCGYTENENQTMDFHEWLEIDKNDDNDPKTLCLDCVNEIKNELNVT